MILLDITEDDMETWVDFDPMTGKLTPREGAPKRVTEAIEKYEKERAEARKNHWF